MIAIKQKGKFLFNVVSEYRGMEWRDMNISLEARV